MVAATLVAEQLPQWWFGPLHNTCHTEYLHWHHHLISLISRKNFWMVGEGRLSIRWHTYVQNPVANYTYGPKDKTAMWLHATRKICISVPATV